MIQGHGRGSSDISEMWALQIVLYRIARTLLSDPSHVKMFAKGKYKLTSEHDIDYLPYEQMDYIE